MTTRKRVSFGSKGSMVETWIIDDVATTRRKCDVREICNDFCDVRMDTTTTTDDVIVVTQPGHPKKEANHNNHHHQHHQNHQDNHHHHHNNHHDHVILNNPVGIMRQDAPPILAPPAPNTPEKSRGQTEGADRIAVAVVDANGNPTDIEASDSGPAVLHVETREAGGEATTSKQTTTNGHNCCYYNHAYHPESSTPTRAEHAPAFRDEAQQEEKKGEEKSFSGRQDQGQGQGQHRPCVIQSQPLSFDDEAKVQGRGRSRSWERVSASGRPQRYKHRSAQEEYYDVFSPQPQDQSDVPTLPHHTAEAYALLQNHYDQTYDHKYNHLYNDQEGRQEDGPTDVINPIGWPLDEATAARLLDAHTGWPLKRSQSLESRDNPFLPGGDLRKEAEDLLSKATIIRDQFYLDDQEKRQLQLQQEEQAGKQVKHVQILDDGQVYVRTDGKASPSLSSPSPNGVVEESMVSAQTASESHSAPPQSSPDAGGGSPRENGEVKEKDSPTNRPEESNGGGDGQRLLPADGEKTQTEPKGSADNSGIPDVEKKRRNKCCTVM